MRLLFDGLHQQLSGLLSVVAFHIDRNQFSSNAVLNLVVVGVIFFGCFLQKLDCDIPRFGELFQFLSDDLCGFSFNRVHHFFVRKEFLEHFARLFLFVIANVEHGQHDFTGRPFRFLFNVLANRIAKFLLLFSAFDALENIVEHRAHVAVSLVGRNVIEPIPGVGFDLRAGWNDRTTSQLKEPLVLPDVLSLKVLNHIATIVRELIEDLFCQTIGRLFSRLVSFLFFLRHRVGVRVLRLLQQFRSKVRNVVRLTKVAQVGLFQNLHQLFHLIGSLKELFDLVVVIRKDRWVDPDRCSVLLASFLLLSLGGILFRQLLTEICGLGSCIDRRLKQRHQLVRSVGVHVELNQLLVDIG